MKPKRILFLTTSVGSGHSRASEAIQEALFEMRHGVINMQTETCFDYFSHSSGKITTRTYVKTIQLMRQVLKYLYNNHKRNTNGNFAKHFLSIPLVEKHKELINNFAPEIIVCTQALSCRFVSILKANGEILAPLIAVITDFDVHPYWFSKNADAFIVPTEEIKKEFITHGIKADEIHAFGIPIHPAFSKTQNKLVLKTKLGIRKDIPVILIIGGGWGLGPIKKIVQHLNSLKMAFQLIVVTGKNRILEKKLNKISFKLRIPVKIYGYINNVDELMDVSDIAITKPGGLTTSELLAKGLPAILVDVIPGHEKVNGNYLINKGAACRIEKISQLKDTIQGLLNNPSELDKMRTKAKAAAKPFAAVDTARLIMNTIYEILPNVSPKKKT